MYFFRQFLYVNLVRLFLGLIYMFLENTQGVVKPLAIIAFLLPGLLQFDDSTSHFGLFDARQDFSHIRLLIFIKNAE